MKGSPLLSRPFREVAIRRLNGNGMADETDYLAAEEPLEIRVEGHNVAIVMRTPGNDRELAAGFLVTEGLVRVAGDLLDLRRRSHCLRLPADRRRKPGEGAAEDHVPPGESENGLQQCNAVDARLRRPESLDLERLTRHVFTSSSCGVCSKATIAAVRQQFPPIDDACQVKAAVLKALPQALADAQETFKYTGGLHACALFDLTGKLLVLREDVGRHNALDKVVGWALLRNLLPLRRHVLLLSGRASFEMMQKALAAGIPIVAAISAPSSLAVDFAQASGQTLVGFLRGEKMNLYTGVERVQPAASSHSPTPALAFAAAD